MKSLRIAQAVAGLALIAAPLTAQVAGEPAVKLAPYAGYMTFGSLVSGPLGSSLTNGSGPVYGGQLSVTLNRNIGIYGNVGYSRPGLEVGLPVLGGVSIGDGSVLMYDAGIQLSAPLPNRVGRSIVPFVQAGIGGMKYSFDLGPARLDATNVSYNVGAGADVPLGTNLGLRLMAKDYIGKFDASDIVGLNLDTRTTHNLAFSLGLTLGF